MRDANPIDATRTDRRPTGRARDPKIVLVTGASTGSGRRVAEALRARGHQVHGIRRSPARPSYAAGRTVMRAAVDAGVRDGGLTMAAGSERVVVDRFTDAGRRAAGAWTTEATA